MSTQQGSTPGHHVHDASTSAALVLPLLRRRTLKPARSGTTYCGALFSLRWYPPAGAAMCMRAVERHRRPAPTSAAAVHARVESSRGRCTVLSARTLAGVLPRGRRALALVVGAGPLLGGQAGEADAGGSPGAADCRRQRRHHRHGCWGWAAAPGGCAKLLDGASARSWACRRAAGRRGEGLQEGTACSRAGACKPEPGLVRVRSWTVRAWIGGRRAARGPVEAPLSSLLRPCCGPPKHAFGLHWAAAPCLGTIPATSSSGGAAFNTASRPQRRSQLPDPHTLV